MRRLCLLAAFGVLSSSLAALAPPPAARAQTPSPSPAATPRPRLIIDGGAGTLLRVEGAYPQRAGVCDFKQRKPIVAKYRGRLTVELAKDGSMRVVNRLSFSNYLRGLAEVPLSWPAAALRAQVIAARTYALDAYRRGRAASSHRSWDICSTDQCQVYRGAAIELGAFGDRWVSAVRATRGQILTYGGRVIQAFFFSTSDGRTKRSFPGGSPQPWLPSVSGEDADAPLAHWTARVRLADLGPILRAAGFSVGTVTGVAKSGDTVTVTSSRGTRSFEAREFRIALNNEAPCRFPSRYPDRHGSAKAGPLPQTVPSVTYSLRRDGSAIVIAGRGWGHGIGMSQFGARSLASRGRSAAAILRHFYGPARITRVAEPDTLRVLAADDLKRVRIEVSGRARVRTETGSVLAPGKRFEITGGSTLHVRRARGAGLKPVLRVTPGTKTLSGTVGDELSLGFAISRSARVHVEVRSGTTVLSMTKPKSFESGDATLTMPSEDDGGAPLEAGDYTAVVVGDDGLDVVRSVPVALRLAALTPLPATPTPAPPRAGSAGKPWLAIGALIALVAGGLAWFLVRRRRRRLSRT